MLACLTLVLHFNNANVCYKSWSFFLSNLISYLKIVCYKKLANVIVILEHVFMSMEKFFRIIHSLG